MHVLFYFVVNMGGESSSEVSLTIWLSRAMMSIMYSYAIFGLGYMIFIIYEFFQEVKKNRERRAKKVAIEGNQLFGIKKEEGV